MLINKECKGSLMKPSHDYINRIAHYISYRSKALMHLKIALKRFMKVRIKGVWISKGPLYRGLGVYS